MRCRTQRMLVEYYEFPATRFLVFIYVHVYNYYSLFSFSAFWLSGLLDIVVSGYTQVSCCLLLLCV